jgi:hypothetical protein
MPARNKGSHWGHSIRVLAVASAAVARRLHQSSCRAQGLTSPHRSRHRRHYSSNHRKNCTRLPQVPQTRSRVSRAGPKCQEFSPGFRRVMQHDLNRRDENRGGSGTGRAGPAPRVEVFPQTSSATAPPKPRPPGTTNLTQWASPVPVHHKAISIVARAVQWVQCCYFAAEGKPCQCARGERVVPELPPPVWPDAPWHSGERWWSRPLRRQGTHVSSDNTSLPAGNAASPERRN